MPRSTRSSPGLRTSGSEQDHPHRGLANTTGISKSTLSRLGTGQRRPTLELLLALSQAYRVPLDDLVGEPKSATGASGSNLATSRARQSSH